MKRRPSRPRRHLMPNMIEIVIELTVIVGGLAAALWLMVED